MFSMPQGFFMICSLKGVFVIFAGSEGNKEILIGYHLFD